MGFGASFRADIGLFLVSKNPIGLPPRSREHLAIAEYLVRRRGAEVGTASMYGYTPLIVAAMHGNARAVKMLLEEGADAFAKDSTDMTALHWAARHDYPDIVKLLLKDR